MGRVNMFTAGCFTNIIGGQKEIPTYDQFINIQKNLNEPKKELDVLLKLYESGINKNKVEFDNLAKLEDLIMQIRTRDNLKNEDIKLNVVREYIYARVSFHRKDKDSKDIRVIVGRTDEWGRNRKKLLGNEKFMKIAKDKLTLAMNDIITESNDLVKVVAF